jgi:hypothetical protein
LNYSRFIDANQLEMRYIKKFFHFYWINHIFMLFTFLSFLVTFLMAETTFSVLRDRHPEKNWRQWLAIKLNSHQYYCWLLFFYSYFLWTFNRAKSSCTCSTYCFIWRRELGSNKDFIQNNLSFLHLYLST